MTSRNITLDASVEELKASLDQFFLIVMGMIIFFMQCGFAFLEAGAVRSKNTTNILIKNFLDSFIAGVGYYICGYAFAFGNPSNPFIGYGNFASSYLDERRYAFFFFQYVFAATAATIVSGAMAERSNFGAYIVYSFFLSAVIYPVVTHWAWSDSGWLAAGGTYTHNGASITVAYQDFAGSGVVHVVGGTAAIIAAYLLGPRLGKYTSGGHVRPIPGHSVPLAALGGFILIFGFLAFNGGSQASISQPDDGTTVAVSIKNTILCGSASAITAMIFNKLLGTSKWSLLNTINGALTGMVAICAGCNVFYPWASIIVGVVAGVAYLVWSWIMNKLKIDDPLDAVAVHLGGGIWGVIAVAIFHKESSLIFAWGMPAFLSLGWQFCGVLAIIAWTAVTCSLMFGILRAMGMLRVSREIEISGLDIAKHGEAAYHVDSYSEWPSEDVESRASPEIDYIVEPAHFETKKGELPAYENMGCDETTLDVNWSMSHNTATLNDLSLAESYNTRL